MESSGDYKVEYKFTADVKGLEEGVKEANNQINSTKLAIAGFATAAGAALVAFKASALDSFKNYETAMFGLANSVKNVEGTIADAMDSIGNSTSGGLLSMQDTAIAMRNLTEYGYSVDQAAQMLRSMTYAAIGNLKVNEELDDKVIRMTESVKSHSEITLRSNGIIDAGTTANEKYAQAVGKSASELSDAEKMQALYNAVVESGNANLGVAEAYQGTYSAAVQRLNSTVQDLKDTFAQMIAPTVIWVTNMLNWVMANKEVIAGILKFTSVIVTGGGAIFALVKLASAAKAAVSWFLALNTAAKGLVGVLSAVVVVAAIAATVNAVNSLDMGLEGLVGSTEEAADSMSGLADSMGGGGGGGGVAGAARDLEKDLEKLRRQYLDDLKQIENRHKETIDKLTKQLREANVDYTRAVEERNAEFATSQAKEEKKHQEKVDDIMEQIRFLQKYNNDYNRQKLANLEFALAKENALYQKQTEAAKAELDLQNENDRIAYEEKRQQYQKELDDELAFMNKHREDLLQVQNWILEDEIESLNRRYAEQQESYAKQTASAGAAGAAIGDNFISNLSKKIKDAQGGLLQQNAFNLGYNTSKDVVSGIWDYLKSVGNSDDNFLARIWKKILGEDTFNRLKYGTVTSGGGGGSRGWAEGGYTGQGNPNQVAGVVHKGEYVLPQDMVDQSTGTPKALGNTYVINVSGTFATSAAERRRVADQIVQAINQNNKSRLEASWQ